MRENAVEHNVKSSDRLLLVPIPIRQRRSAQPLQRFDDTSSMPPSLGVSTRTRAQRHQEHRALPSHSQGSRNAWATPGRDDATTTAQRARKTSPALDGGFLLLPSYLPLSFKQERRDRATARKTLVSEGPPLSAVSSEMTPTHSFSRNTKKGVPLLWATFGRSCLCVVGLVFLVSCWGLGSFAKKTPPDGKRAAARTSAQESDFLKNGASDQKVQDTAMEEASVAGAKGNLATWFGGARAAATPLVGLDTPRQFGGALALKSERIVYCPIQKVACTEWLKVFRWIDGQEDWTEPRHIKHGLDPLGSMDVERGNFILNSPEWLKFAVVREPAERLLSCFLQKCNRWNMQGEYENCPYLELWPELFRRGRFPSGVPSEPNDDTLAVVVEAFESRGRNEMFASYVDSITERVKAAPCEQNGHWSPQFCHCSLDLTAPVYSIVGWSNMTEAAAAAIVPATSSRRRGLEIADFLDGRMKNNHERHGKKTFARSSTTESYTAEMLRAVHDAYAKDYELFSQYWE